MLFDKQRTFKLISFFCFIAGTYPIITASTQVDDVVAKVDHLLQETKIPTLDKNPILKKIIISGAHVSNKEAILNKIPYQEGLTFDPAKSALAINNLYQMGIFKQITLEIEVVEGGVILYVNLEERPALESVSFQGNHVIREDRLKEKLGIGRLTCIDEETAFDLAEKIRKLYAEEHYHRVAVHPQVHYDNQTKKATATFTIDEGPKSKICRVEFEGNHHIPSRKLRKMLFTRENWLLGFLDNGGTYNEEQVEIDKHRLEYIYRDHGFLSAKTYKSQILFSDDQKNIAVTYYVNEGKQYTVNSIKAPDDDIFTQEESRPLISLEEGKPYHHSEVIKSMNRLRELWGLKGYIYADVYPQVIPNENTATVDIAFHVERGKRLYVNRISITGNHQTHDKVIRRQLDITEGDLITSDKLERSKSMIEYLGFFERGGINVHTHRISDTLADLEFNVQEGKTGNFDFKVAYGADKEATKSGLRGSVSLEKANLLGLGIDVRGIMEAYVKNLKRLELRSFHRNIFDYNAAAEVQIYKRWDEFEHWQKFVKGEPHQEVKGGEVKLYFQLPWIDKRMNLLFNLGGEHIKTNQPQLDETLRFKSPLEQSFITEISNQSFKEGALKWFGLEIGKDTRNHPVYPYHGYKVMVSSKVAPSMLNSTFSFLKTEAQMSAYTSLLNQDDLVLGVNFKLSSVRSLGDGKNIPFKELFHMGGQNTVRGFTWGGVGPAIKDSLVPMGGREALLFNTELIFPIMGNFSMKGHLFYDAGAGWNAQVKKEHQKFVVRNDFNVRHAVGFGINLIKPMAAKIDWGFKLDRKPGESAHEFHISTNMAW